MFVQQPLPGPIKHFLQWKQHAVCLSGCLCWFMALYLVVCLQVAVWVACMSNTRPLFKRGLEFFRMWATARVKREQDFSVLDSAAARYFSIISQNKRNASVPEGRATKKDEPSQVLLVYPFHRRWLDKRTSETSGIVNVVIDFSRRPWTSALGSVLSHIKNKLWVCCLTFLHRMCCNTFLQKETLIALSQFMHK